MWLHPCVALLLWPDELSACLPSCLPSTGELAITYLDEDMRISRGDKGNLFVLLMDDPDDRP
jgi:hypothetical protein